MQFSQRLCYNINIVFLFYFLWPDSLDIIVTVTGSLFKIHSIQHNANLTQEKEKVDFPHTTDVGREAGISKYLEMAFDKKKLIT